LENKTIGMLQIYQNSARWTLSKCIMFILTTTSARPEPEYTLRRVMSSKPIQDEQSTKDCKQMTNNQQKIAST